MRDMGTEVGGILGFTTVRSLDIKVDYRDARVDGLPRTPWYISNRTRPEVTLLRESTTQVPEILDKFGFDKAEGCA